MNSHRRVSLWRRWPALFLGLGLVLSGGLELSLAGAAAAAPAGHKREFGVVSVDGVSWGKHGLYLQNFLAQLSTQWNKISLAATPPQDVKVEFYLNADGRITDLQITESQSSPTTSEAAASAACLNAVRVGSPYKKWTRDMTADLGARQKFGIVFVYK